MMRAWRGSVNAAFCSRQNYRKQVAKPVTLGPVVTGSQGRPDISITAVGHFWDTKPQKRAVIHKPVENSAPGKSLFSHS